MEIIHGRDATVLPRLVAETLAERLRAMPALVVTGARQTGKRTLVQQLTPGTRRYRSLDDLDVLDAARRDPEVLVGGDGPVTLDEIQRAPGRLHAVKRAIDRHRSQYDVIDGFARHRRDALPHASFVGFTGTPIEKTDAKISALRLRRTGRGRIGPSRGLLRLKEKPWPGWSCSVRSFSRVALHSTNRHPAGPIRRASPGRLSS